MTERASPTTRHPVRTGVFLFLSALIAVPVFSALYRALDLFGLPGALGILIALALILSVAWIVHLLRTYGAGLTEIAVSIGRSVGDGLAANPFAAQLGRRLASPARYIRR